MREFDAQRKVLAAGHAYFSFESVPRVVVHPLRLAGSFPDFLFTGRVERCKGLHAEIYSRLLVWCLTPQITGGVAVRVDLHC